MTPEQLDWYRYATELNVELEAAMETIYSAETHRLEQNQEIAKLRNRVAELERMLEDHERRADELMEELQDEKTLSKLYNAECAAAEWTGDPDNWRDTCDAEEIAEIEQLMAKLKQRAEEAKPPSRGGQHLYMP